MVFKISFSQNGFFFSKPVHLRVTIEFLDISENCEFGSKNAFFFFFLFFFFFFFFLPKNRNSDFRLKMDFIQTELNAESRFEIRSVCNEIRVFFSNFFCV